MPGPYNPPQKNNSPAWWTKLKDKLAQLSAGGPTTPPNRPPYRPLNTIQNTPATLQTSLQPVAGYGPSTPPNRPPAWLGQTTPTTAPTQPIIPTGSFIGGGGTSVLTSVGPMSTNIPTGSMLAAGGQYVMGPNGRPYLRDQPVGPNTFIGAGGDAVRGPDFAVETITQPTAGGSGGGGGYQPYRRRRGGGGGGYQPVEHTPREAPAWFDRRGLANWSIG